MAHLSLNDGSANSPRLRCDLNIGTLWMLPEWTKGPTNLGEDPAAATQGVIEAGFEGVQSMGVEPAKSLGIPVCGMGRVDAPEAADALAAEHKAAGFQLSTVHVGSGLESDAEMDALVGAILEASARHDYPIFVETHRATITQDLRRTVDLCQRMPDVRFNGDFSHWYTGLEMTYGDFEARLDFIEPVFERVRYMHGRFGTSGAIQVAVNGADDERDFVQHHKAFLTRAMKGFLKKAGQGDVLIYAPELLPPVINYGREFPQADGTMREEADRFDQALILCDIAKSCWRDAGGAE